MGGLGPILTNFGAPTFCLPDLFTAFMIVLIGGMMVEASTWNLGAKIVPLTVGGLALTFATISLFNQVFRKPETAEEASLAADARAKIGERIHMDLASDMEDLPTRVILTRGAIFFGWLLAFMLSMATIGLIPTVPLFVIIFMRVEASEPWKLVLPQAVGLTLFIYILFDQLLTIPWPQTLLGHLVPVLKVIPSV
jgi:hypothetical protein